MREATKNRGRFVDICDCNATSATMCAVGMSPSFLSQGIERQGVCSDAIFTLMK